jgi:hypothetical protein
MKVIYKTTFFLISSTNKVDTLARINKPVDINKAVPKSNISINQEIVIGDVTTYSTEQYEVVQVNQAKDLVEAENKLIVRTNITVKVI